MVRRSLTQERLKELLDYDPHTGIFTHKLSRGSLKGSQAGTACKLGYHRIQIDYQLHLAHRLAFLFMEGCFPKENVDHRDGNPSNNCWSNLRECTQKQNIQNSLGSGKFYKNVYFTKGPRKKPFNVKVEVEGRPKSFGYYATPEEANEVAIILRREIHGEFALENREQ